MGLDRNLQFRLVESTRCNMHLGRNEASSCLYVHIQQPNIVKRRKQRAKENYFWTGEFDKTKQFFNIEYKAHFILTSSLNY